MNRAPFDPNRLPENPALPQDPARRAFILRIAPLARQVQVLTGIPASVAIAQAIHETGWGTSKIYRDTKNLFGFKTGGRCDGTDFSDGKEWLEVPWVSSNKRPINEWCPYFRKYETEFYSILDWALRFYRFVFKTKRDDGSIAKALSYRRNWRAFLDAGALWNYNSLTNDPRSVKYTAQIKNIIQTYKLYLYDVPVENWNLREDVHRLVPVPQNQLGSE